MPLDRDGLFHHAERNFRGAVMSFENGSRIELPEIQAMSIEADEADEMHIAGIGAREAPLSFEGVDLNNMQDTIETRQRQVAFDAALERIRAGRLDGIDAITQAMKSHSVFSTSFMNTLNAMWESLGDDFELSSEEEYVATDPISFDELMGVL